MSPATASRSLVFLVPLLALGLGGCSEQKMATIVPFTSSSDGKLTWNRDVLPIVQQRCQGCHAPDGIGPFSMMQYSDVTEHVDKMAENVTNRVMPPWMPDPTCGTFVDDRRLTDDEIAVFAQWAADGALEGDPKDAPSGGGATADHLASVDATLMSETAYTPIGDPNDPKRLDDYHCFILDPKLDQDRFLVGFEVQPGVTREVHHVLLYPAKAADALAKDAETPEAGWTCFGGPGTGGDAVLGGWVPGQPPNRFPATTGIQMNKGDLIVMQVHYNLLNGPPLPDRTLVKLQYSTGPVENVAQLLPAVNYGFKIPPHSTDYTSSQSIKLPVSVRVWGVIPHMHTLGKHISVKTTSQCLVDIPSWDFHWQQTYFYDKPITLAVGDKATLSCTWTNPTDRTITWGESTTDEMCLSFMYLTY